MRRAALLVVLLAAALPACAATERPEGIVERWLISLNQGAAGDPGTYADDEVSNLVVPDWDELEPGALDLIEVGRGGTGEGGSFQVPFRVVYQDGREEAFLATLVGGRVVALPRTTVGPIERPTPDLALGAWLAALGAAALLILATAGLMRLVPEGRAGSSR